MSKKRGLGRGLGALIPSEGSSSDTSAAGVRQIPIGQIKPNPHQPRTKMDQDKLAELAASIKEHGLIQPLIVTESAGGFILIAGERRWRAGQYAKLTHLPAIVKEATPQEMLELAIVENIQRADLNPLEEAHAYQQLMEQFGLTQEEVSRRVGKGRSTVANLVRLINLPPEIQQAVSDGQLSGAHARALLSLPTAAAQTAAMHTIIKLNLNVRQTELLAKLLPLNLPDDVQNAALQGHISFDHATALTALPTSEMKTNLVHQIISRRLTVGETKLFIRRLLASQKPKPRQKALPAAELVELQRQFEQSLGTRVSIEKSGRGGKVVIHYYSNEELQAIYDAIISEDK